jgi:hydroxyacylglutathione hydrolase
MTLEIFARREVGALACNCYIVGDPATREAIVIDPGDEPDELSAALAQHRLSVTAIVATHAHFDHVLAAERLTATTGAPFLLHRDDLALLDWLQESARVWLGRDVGGAPDVDTLVAEGDALAAGGVELSVLHTPGHSPGSISLVADDVVFSGDTLFAGSVGRTDLPGGDSQELARAIRSKLFALGDDARVMPGHGPPTTLAEERRSNPFVGERGGWRLA